MAENVKNVVLVGQGGVGKTMLAEAMLHLSGATSRLGGHAGTKPTLDYDPEEEKRSFSIKMSMAPINWNGCRLNIVDAPCYPDFIGDAYCAMSACETAVFVTDAAAGPQATTTRLWYAAENLQLARAVFVNRIDRSELSFKDTMQQLKERFGDRLAPVTLPIGTGEGFDGIIDVIKMQARRLGADFKPVISEIPENMMTEAEEARNSIVDLIVEADDALMEKYLEGEKLTQSEIEGLLDKAIADRVFVPVFAGVCTKEEGVISFMDEVVSYFPKSSTYGKVPLVNGELLDIDPLDDRPVAHVFKILNDPQQGRLAFVKVLTGTLTPGIELTCARTRKAERIAHMYHLMGRETTEAATVEAGDIVAIPKLDVQTGDTLSATGKVEAATFKFPNSLYRTAIEADQRGSEDKLYTFLEKMCETDPTLRVSRNEDTGQTVISAIGEAQIGVLLSRLESRANVSAHTVALKIPYKETIRRVATGHGRHKKQTGGAGQFADVRIRIEPNPEAGYEFLDEVVGGAIPRGFIPAVDKGAQETLKAGVLAGFPMIDVKVAAYDGQFHPVDSNEMAFRSAARLAILDAVPQAEPVILEPIAQMEIVVPESYAGSIMGDISASRGRVEGMDTTDRGNVRISAKVPYAEVLDYATRLRSLSRGTGEFAYEITSYEQVPHNIQEKLIFEYERKRAQGR